MIAYYETRRNKMDATRILRVDHVLDLAHAKKIEARIKAVHADHVRLLAMEDYTLAFTAHEIENERNVLGTLIAGGFRRYSTGTQTVTIPEN